MVMESEFQLLVVKGLKTYQETYYTLELEIVKLWSLDLTRQAPGKMVSDWPGSLA